MAPQTPNSDDAHLPVISAGAILKGDASVGELLFETCVETGFFYLDLRDAETQHILADVDGMFDTSSALFKLPLDEKNQFETGKYGPSKLCGYKPAGLTTGPVEGKRDGFESYMIPNDGLFKLSDAIPFVGPPVLEQREQLLNRGVSGLHQVGLALLSTLQKRLPGRQDLVSSHDMGKLSTSGLGLLRYESYDKETSQNIGHIAHTDIGTFSFVFSHVGGLQVLMPQTNEWSFVPPKPGHAIVNVGDSLTFLSGGKLKSCLHRVIPHEDAEQRTKYTCVYLLRPARDTPMTDSTGKQWRSEDWHNRKFKVLRANLDEQKQNEVLTGRHGYIGQWTPQSQTVS